MSLQGPIVCWKIFQHMRQDRQLANNTAQICEPSLRDILRMLLRLASKASSSCSKYVPDRTGLFRRPFTHPGHRLLT